METRAPFVIVGAFVLATIVAVFGFVYWLNNSGGVGPRTTYHVQFDGSVPGLMVGAGVLFNGIRVGEVTDQGLARNTGKLDSIVVGIEKMTGGGTQPQKVTYDLRAAQGFVAAVKAIKGQLVLPEPSAIAMLETQRMLFSRVKEYPDFAEFVWA